ncbi:hypothetical protein D3C75_1364920 [compost metagenome]
MLRGQLQHIFIPGYDHHFTPGRIGLAGNTSDNIVRLITVDLKLRHAQVTQQAFQ